MTERDNVSTCVGAAIQGPIHVSAVPAAFVGGADDICPSVIPAHRDVPAEVFDAPPSDVRSDEDPSSDVPPPAQVVEVEIDDPVVDFIETRDDPLSEPRKWDGRSTASEPSSVPLDELDMRLTMIKGEAAILLFRYQSGTMELSGLSAAEARRSICEIIRYLTLVSAELD